MLVREKRLMIPGAVGELEAMYLHAEAARGVALICHPNPEQGGTMLNKVVSTLQRTARDQGLSTLRFNYRGAGKSAGQHDMGAGEVDDAEAALNWLLAQEPDSSADLPIYLLGFSFGGFVAASLSGRLRQRGVSVEHTVLVAPAVHRLQAPQQLTDSGMLTVIQPELDEVIEPELVYQWVGQLVRQRQLCKIADSGHFFHGKLVELKACVLQKVFAV